MLTTNSKIKNKKRNPFKCLGQFLLPAGLKQASMCYLNQLTYFCTTPFSPGLEFNLRFIPENGRLDTPEWTVNGILHTLHAYWEEKNLI
jgi:hypothetical protein